EIAVGDAPEQLRNAEGCPVGDHRQVAHERHHQPAALARAVDGHEHDLRAALELDERRQVDAIGLAIDRLAALVLAPHLAANTEVVAGAGQRQDVAVRIAPGQHRRLLDAVVHLDGAGVAPLGTVEHDAQDAVGLRAPQVPRAEVDGLLFTRRHARVLPADAPGAPAPGAAGHLHSSVTSVEEGAARQRPATYAAWPPCAGSPSVPSATIVNRGGP